MLTRFNPNIVREVGLDEAGRGPAFGRVYAAAVIWPADLTSDLIRDSKKISEAKMKESYDFVMANALAVSVSYATASEIDQLNILQADMLAMHRALDSIPDIEALIVDGNYFKPYKGGKGMGIPWTTVVKGDSKFYSIAAASIVAKYSRDAYITEICGEYPDLNTKYDLLRNKGYPAPNHLAGIQTHGISPFHRKTFKCCGLN